MPISAFEKPIRRLTREVRWLEMEFMQAALSERNRRTQLACEMSVIRIHDAWARFCRELIVLSANGRTVTLTGMPLSQSHSAIVNCTSVVPVLLSLYPKNRRKFEPRWADATECIDAGKTLGIRNLSTVAGALAAANSPADRIRRVRNFYAHRQRRTATDALRAALFSAQYPEVFSLANYESGGLRVIESWTRGLAVVATAAAQ